MPPIEIQMTASMCNTCVKTSCSVFHHVSNGELGELHSRAVGRRRRDTVPERVYCDHEIAAAVDKLAGTDAGFQLISGPGNPGGEQDCV